MHTYTKNSNGHELTIAINEEELLERLDRLAEEAKKDFGESNASDSDEYIYEYKKVGGDEMEFCTLAEVEHSIDHAKKTIADVVAYPNMLWERMPLKKNGTFKRSTKPQLWQSDFGPYWEDSYGWNCYAIRIEASTDTEASVVMTNVVEHY